MQLQLTRESVKGLWRDVASDIQSGKVAISKAAISQFQAQGKLPNNANIVAYVTSTNRRNRYINLDHFYKKMPDAPKLFDKSFIFRTKVEEDGEVDYKRIAEAARFAYQMVEQQTKAYPTYTYHTPTYKLFRSIATYVNGKRTMNPEYEIQRSDVPPVYEVTNLAEYASTAEARAVYFNKMQGIIYYAANRTQNRFPDLGVMFTYAKSRDYGLPHPYDVPVLTIGPFDEVMKGFANNRAQWSVPGENNRRRKKERRRKTAAVRRINKRGDLT